MPTVLITGTSTGIGHVTTEVLAARGWRVFATMRDLTREDSLEGALENAGLRDRVTICQLDMSDAELDPWRGCIHPNADRRDRCRGAQCRSSSRRRA